MIIRLGRRHQPPPPAPTVLPHYAWAEDVKPGDTIVAGPILGVVCEVQPCHSNPLDVVVLMTNGELHQFERMLLLPVVAP